MTMPILHVGSKFNTAQLRLRSDSRVALSLLSILGPQLGVMLVSVAFVFNSESFLNSFVLASGTVKKVIEINPYLLGTMAGGAGTCLNPFLEIQV